MNLLPQEIIRKKRDGASLSETELVFLVQGMSNGSISEGQTAAFAMAVFFNGLNTAERVALTRAMTQSGEVLDWSAANLTGPVLDKHSTGGVGDKVSLVLAPILAACGAFVPMISGRGLGHTGGTLDKLDSIPGYSSTPDLATLRRVVSEVGCAIVGQTAELAPADRRFYAIRDVTATVESIGLIVASILSKKLAAGLEGLVVDVKMGSGAFMPTLDASRDLANSIVAVANDAGLPTTALITDMNQVLGECAGNALEVREAVAYLSGERRNPRLHEVVLELAAEMLLLGGLAADNSAARERLDQVLSTGRAAECFGRMVANLGGPADFIERIDAHLPRAPVVMPVLPVSSGYVEAMEVRSIGLVIVELGGGRRKANESVDYTVGLSDCCQLGDWVDGERPLALVHAASKDAAVAVASGLKQSIRLSASPPETQSIVYERLVKP